VDDKEFLEAFKALFQGRTDVYGKGYQKAGNPKMRYSAVREELTDEVLLSHFQGTEAIGVYPLVGEHVKWFAVDIDTPKGSTSNPNKLWDLAKEQAHKLRNAGFFTYIERSRSGAGYHVWGFLDDWAPAEVVLRAVKPHLITGTEMDRVFPVQDTAADLGNLIAFPFNGKAVKDGHSMFVNSDQQPIPPKEFLAGVNLNPVAVVTYAAEKAPERVASIPAQRFAGGPSRTQGTVPSGFLKLLSPYGCDFMKHAWDKRTTLPEPEWYAAIQQCTMFEDGRQLAHAISRDYPGYDPAEVDDKFDHACQQPSNNCTTLQELFPDVACKNCRCKAPYQLAQKSVLDLVRGGVAPMERFNEISEDIAVSQMLNRGEMELGYSYGHPRLDEKTRLRGSEITVVGAMQNIGKTWWMIEVIYQLAKQGIAVFGFSAETARTSFRRRLLARVSGVEARALRGERSYPLTPDELKRLEAAKAEVRDLPIFLDYTSTSADEVLAQVERTLLQNDMPLDARYAFVFDYLQFGSKKPGEDSDYDRLSRLSAEFKYIVKIMDRPGVVLSQLQREREGNETPKINWFKGTGRIESDMDVGIVIVGDRVDGPQAPRQLWIVKQREGLSNVSLSYTLHQGTGHWEEADGAVVPEALTGEGELGAYSGSNVTNTPI